MRPFSRNFAVATVSPPLKGTFSTRVEVSALKHAGMPGLHGTSPLLRLAPDERLVTLTRRGNQGAFEALVSRYQSRLQAFCRHMLGSKEDAEDVLQEVFAAAFNAMHADDRPLSCEDVRLELGEVAEGLRRTSAPVRRHLKACDRCAGFKSTLRDTNKALAAIFPVGPLILFKKLVLAHLGTTASGGGATAAGSAGASAAGSAAASGAISAGVSAAATKAAAGIAAAAIVTAGAVEVRQATGTRHDAGP